MTVDPVERARRHDLRLTVVAAAAQLLRDGGADAVTTRAVAQAAGVQAPTIYRLFGDKDGLVEAVAEHVMADYVASKTAFESDAEGDPVANLRAAWQMHVAFGLANPELYALIGTGTRTPVSPATAAGIEVLRSRVRRVAAAGLLTVGEERAVMMIHAAGNGTVLALLAVPEGERDPGLSDAMFEAVTGRVVRAEPVLVDTAAVAVATAFSNVVPDLPGLTDGERTLLSEWLSRTVTALQE